MLTTGLKEFVWMILTYIIKHIGYIMVVIPTLIDILLTIWLRVI